MGFPIRVLLVEDEPGNAERLNTACTEAIEAEVAVEPAEDERAARAALADGEFDLVVCALAQGIGLLRLIRLEHPGVPVVVHSGAEGLGSVNDIIALATQEDLFGTDVEQPMIRFHPSEELDACAGEIRAILSEIAEVAALELAQDEGLALETSEARAIQIFSRRTGASRAEVTGLSGGLSGAKTVVVDAAAESGMRTAHVVGKLAPVETIPASVDGYEQATPHLPAGLGAALAGVVTAGAGDLGASFYRLADDFRRSWFDCLASAPGDAATAVARLHARFDDRYASAPVEAESVGQLRRHVITDEELATAVAPVPSTEHLEDVQVETRRDIQHRDLHGLNVLISDSNEPLLIDYDNYAPGNAAIDPVTLELSAFFHRDETAQQARRGWPSMEAAREWFDLDAYLADCPYPEAIRACRAWAEDAAANRRELAATLLSVALRQFWFDNTDKELAAALMEVGETGLAQ